MRHLIAVCMLLLLVGCGARAQIVTSGGTASGIGASASTVPPVISGHTQSDIQTTKALIGWVTDIAANSQVCYSTDHSYGTCTTLDTTLTTAHSVQLTGLVFNTPYFYVAKSQAAVGGLATSPEQTFTTNTAPVLTNFSCSPTETTAVCTWTTNEVAGSQACRGADGGPWATGCSPGSEDATQILSHSQTLTGLTGSTTYYAVGKSTAATGTTGVSSQFTFVTSAPGGSWTVVAPVGVPTPTLPWTPGTPPGTTLVVNSCGTSPTTPGTFPYALANAVDGDEIVYGDAGTPDPDCTYATTLLPAKTTSANYVIIRSYGSTNVSFPARGTRFDPTLHVAYSARITINSSGAALFQFGANVKKYILLGLELRYKPGVSNSNALIRISPASGITASNLPQNIWIDRSWIHGSGQGADVSRLVELAGSGHVFIDSFWNDAWATGKELQCIAGWNAAQSFLVENNYFSCAGENIIFGGANPSFQPANSGNFRVHKSHFVQQLYWTANQPTYWEGQTPVTKNLFEMKCGEQWELLGNVFENKSYSGGQMVALAIKDTMTSVANTSCYTRNYAVKNNIVNGAVGVMQVFAGFDNSSPVLSPPQDNFKGEKMEVINNLFLNINKTSWDQGDTTSARHLFWFNDGPRYTRFQHNTTTWGSVGSCGTSFGFSFVFIYPTTGTRTKGNNNDFSSNIFCQGTIHGEIPSQGTPALVIPNWSDIAQSFVWGKNALFGQTCTNWDEVWSTYSCGADAAIFFKAFGTRTDFTDAANNDFRLAVGSNLKNAGTDGTDVGVNDWASIPNCSHILTGGGAYCPVVVLANPITVSTVNAISGDGTCNGTNTFTVTGTNFKRGTSITWSGSGGNVNGMFEENSKVTVTNATTLTVKTETRATGTYKLNIKYAGLMQGANTNSWTTGALKTITCP